MIYRIYKDKRHQIVSEGDLPIHGKGFQYVEADEDGWIPWHGGECPLPDDAGYEARRRDGDITEVVDTWCHAEAPYDIIAYRPILDAKPEPPEWDGEGLPPVGCECEFEYIEDGNWVVAKVIGYDGPACVVAIDGYGYEGSPEPSDFRPIRSEEDRVVDEMQDAVRSEIGGTVIGCVARALYRAGYRKT